MIAADTPRLALATSPAPTSESIFGRLAALLTRIAEAGATDEASDASLWTSVARGF